MNNVVHIWQAERYIARCHDPDHTCDRTEFRHNTVDGLKQLIRTHLRQRHRVTTEPVWRGP